MCIRDRYEPELRSKTAEIVSDGVKDREVLDTADIRTAKVEFVLPAAEGSDMQFTEITPANVSAEFEPEAEFQKVVMPADTVAHIEIPIEMVAAPEVLLEDKQPVTEVSTTAITTETWEEVLSPEMSELEAEKEPSPKMEAVEMPDEANVGLEVPIVEAGDVQLIEGVAPIGTKETITERVILTQEPEMNIMPTEELQLLAEEMRLEDLAATLSLIHI